jgi:hypothetical protein
VQPARDQRDAARPADQQDADRRDTGALQYPPGLVDRPVHQRTGDPLQLFAREVQRMLGPRYVHRRSGRARKHLLRRPYFRPKRLAVTLLADRVGRRQPLPDLGVA